MRNFLPVLIGLFVVVVIIFSISAGIASVSNRHTETGCTVEDKDRAVKVVDGSSSTSYRIYTDCGVFVIEDVLIFGKFNSADTYSSLKVGSTYDLEVVGFRN